MKRYIKSSISLDEYNQAVFVKETSTDPKEKAKAQRIIREFRNQEDELVKTMSRDDAIALQYGFSKTEDGDYSNGKTYIKKLPSGTYQVFSADGACIADTPSFRVAITKGCYY